MQRYIFIIQFAFACIIKNIVYLQPLKMVGVAQLVRVLDCGSRCRRFNSGHPPKFFKKRLFSRPLFLVIDPNCYSTSQLKWRTFNRAI